jgi:glutathione S-transferase
MIKLWGRRSSSNVQKVLWCCDELGIDYQQVDVGGPFGGTDTEAYGRLNPNRLVPTIEDGDFVLWESNAILRYLNDKYGDGRLLPTTAEGRAEADRWLFWDQSTLTRSVFPVFFAMVRTPQAERDPAKLERDIAAAAKTLAILDGHLADKAYVAGEAFGLGDIALGIWTHRWFALDITRPPLPKLEAWYHRLTDRLAYRGHVMVPMS